MKKRLSIFFISIGLILIANLSLISITGYVINGNFKIGGSVLGLAFIIGGLALFLAGKEGRLEKNLAQQILRSGKILRKREEFMKIARKMGYTIGKDDKEGTRILDKYGMTLTTIPSKVSKGVYYTIMKTLATGKSSFRRRHGYQPA